MFFEYSNDKDSNDLKAVRVILDDFNREIAGPYHDKPLNIFIKDNNGVVKGGLIGVTYWNWLYVDYLAVDESLRGEGIGSELLKKAEAEAVRRGCHSVHLDTHDFQALDFYKSHGYRINSEIKNLPDGHIKYQLIKEL